VSEITCPICGGRSFSEEFGRPAARCDGCGSVERTRATKLLLDWVVRPTPAARVLHIGPEPDLSQHFRATLGASYDPATLKPRKPAEGERVFDPAVDLDGLEPGSLDIVLHHHVVQEVVGNYTIFLQRLHAALKPGGYHIFSVPISSGYYQEDADPRMEREERKERFGQSRSQRRFGRSSFDVTLGAVFGLTRSYSLLDHLLPEIMVAAAVPETVWKLGSNTVFCVRR
jgi:hypothetical protein